MKLYSFYLSSASYRVRIALGLKGLTWETVAVPLKLDGGENHTEAYGRTNPQQLVPTLVDGELVVSQTLAIFDALERRHPVPPLFPRDDAGRAAVWSFCSFVACEIQPLQNLRTERYLRDVLQLEPDARAAFKRHFQVTGLDTLERMLAGHAGVYAFGDRPTAADCFLVPQAATAERNGVTLDRWPTLARVVATCRSHPAFEAAAPARQPDAPPA